MCAIEFCDYSKQWSRDEEDQWHILESLRFRLVAYSGCASHGRGAPCCALRFCRFFNERSGELEILYHNLPGVLDIINIKYKVINESNNYLGRKDESSATRPLQSQIGKCIFYTQVCFRRLSSLHKALIMLNIPVFSSPAKQCLTTIYLLC